MIQTKIMIPDRLYPQRAKLSVEGVCFVITTKRTYEFVEQEQ